ncbi:unnamed protein product [Cylicocyclus nassatus]|uniref:non-specific serine/threonine protein kinase n=1 Tax=Cylicocyclus nassatus TaxID=53992 RepID=A0AA36GUP7_CYLNA|nr:unnamed protein product [Cylicocyclus nassatus]
MECNEKNRSEPRLHTHPPTRVTVTRATRSFGRVYPPGFPVMKPHQISAMKSPMRTHLSPMYRFSKTKTYMEQCFDLIKVLGNGSFGQVLDVKCLETGKRFAIKKALRTFESSGKRRRQLLEVITHESVAPHPNIVQFEKAWEERGRLYIQTELCGPSLNEYRCEFGPLLEDELWTVLVDTLKALDHLHSENILHLDVKPSNIFISLDNSMCKLGDFGLAINLNLTSAEVADEGDRNYMAPEVLNGPPSAASDMFSLGVTMLELSTTVDVEDERTVIRKGPLPKSWFDGVPCTLREKIVRLLNFKPRCRPQAKRLLDETKKIDMHRAVFRTLRETSTPCDKEYYMDKDWEYEFEGMLDFCPHTQNSNIFLDVVYPPSLRTKRKKRLVFDDEDEKEKETAVEVKLDANTPSPTSAQPFTRVLDFDGSPPLKKAKISLSVK